MTVHKITRHEKIQVFSEFNDGEEDFYSSDLYGEGWQIVPEEKVKRIQCGYCRQFRDMYKKCGECGGPPPEGAKQ